MKKMDALEFYKSHESAPLPDIGDLVSLTVEEICELMEQYHQSKVNNGVLDDVINLFPSYDEALEEAQKTYLSKHVSEGVELYEEKAFMKGCNFIAQKVIGNNL